MIKRARNIYGRNFKAITIKPYANAMPKEDAQYLTRILFFGKR
jgi:hypothetical protein